MLISFYFVIQLVGQISTKWQILTKIELPQAFPTIMMGINQTTMMAMSMVVEDVMRVIRGEMPEHPVNVL